MQVKDFKSLKRINLKENVTCIAFNVKMVRQIKLHTFEC